MGVRICMRVRMYAYGCEGVYVYEGCMRMGVRVCMCMRVMRMGDRVLCVLGCAHMGVRVCMCMRVCAYGCEGVYVY